MDFVPGALVAGRYRLKRMVGAGGMGEVWLGDDAQGGVRVAVKHLLPAAAKHHEVVARFKREAYLLGRVESAYVARVVDFFDDETYGLVLVMEFIEGPSLAHVLEERTLSLEEAVDLGVDLLRALNDLHSAKIVHRDLKPGNIIMRPTPTGKPRATVVDFGISRLLADKGENEVTGITRANIALGTVEYMAPEQILNSRDVTQVSDLYAVGIILFRSVKGHHAFGDRRGEELARAKLIEEPPALETPRRDAVATGLSAIVARALKKRPSQRYPSAREMLTELEQIQQRSIANADLDDSTTDSGDTAVKPSPLARPSQPSAPPRAVSSPPAGRVAAGRPPSPPRAPLPSAAELAPPPSASGEPVSQGASAAASVSSPGLPAARASMPSLPDAAPANGPPSDPGPKSPVVSKPPTSGSGSHAVAVRASLSSLSDYSPPPAALPPPPSELTSERNLSGLSRGTVALAVLTAFAVGAAVGLVIAPSSAPAGRAEASSTQASALCVTATASAPAEPTALAPATAAPSSTPIQDLPAASASAVAQVASSPSAKSSSSSSAKPKALTGKLPTATQPPKPTSDGLGEDDPPKPPPTAPATAPPVDTNPL